LRYASIALRNLGGYPGELTYTMMALMELTGSLVTLNVLLAVAASTGDASVAGTVASHDGLRAAQLGSRRIPIFGEGKRGKKQLKNSPHIDAG